MNMKRYEGLSLTVEEPPEWLPEEYRLWLQNSGLRLVVVDVETTRLPAYPGSTTEIGWFDLNDGVGGRFVPPHTLDGADPESLAISRYWERLKDEPQDRDQVSALYRILGGDGQKVVIVGANPEFDKKHLAFLFYYVGVTDTPTDGPWHYRHLDVSSGAYWLNPTRPPGRTMGLADTVAFCGVNYRNHHSAMGDVLMTAETFVALENRRASLPSVSKTTPVYPTRTL